MTRLLVESFPGRATASPVVLHHVDARFSDDIQSIGKPGWLKVIRLIRYCFKAIGIRFKHGPVDFYYIPAPDIRAAVYRDWLVMLLCRPFFSRLIYHHHALGLADWANSKASGWERWLCRLLLWRPDLSIVLGDWNRRDAEPLLPKRIIVVPNGIPDPCPDYLGTLKDERQRRRLTLQATLQNNTPTQAAPVVYRIVYLGLCCREKGLFETLKGVEWLTSQLANANIHIRLELKVAGKFFRPEEHREFTALASTAITAHPNRLSIDYVGFVDASAKDALLRNADCLCFPTTYSAESFGLVIVEAMAYGLSVLTTRWHGIDSLLPHDYQGVVSNVCPEEIGSKLQTLMTRGEGDSLRARFELEYRLERWTSRMEQAFASVNG